jgi:hypothetical protein
VENKLLKRGEGLRTNYSFFEKNMFLFSLECQTFTKFSVKNIDSIAGKLKNGVFMFSCFVSLRLEFLQSQLEMKVEI